MGVAYYFFEEDSPSMDNNTILFAILYVILGGISCFFGYRLFRVMLALVGFAGGVLFALAMIDLLVIDTDTDRIISYAETVDELSAQSGVVGIVVTLIVGLIAAAVVQVFYKFGVFLLAGSAAAFVTFALLSNNTELDDEIRLFAILFMFGVVGIFALRIERHVLVLSTALVGAFFIVLAGYLVLATDDPQLDQPFGNDAVSVPAGFVMLLLWLLFAIAGAYKQFDDADTLLDVY